ncbi:integrase core domain-containing protein [Bradyrhizobium oropedii]|uniref:integrase core domain-containing protein n=1 Tax=Bradyrhizobium oropedii TaxID=1571201 RepID=UPI003B8495DC
MLDFSQPGKRTDNAFAGTFNGRFRAECLDTHRFSALRACSVPCDWRQPGLELGS